MGPAWTAPCLPFPETEREVRSDWDNLSYISAQSQSLTGRTESGKLVSSAIGTGTHTTHMDEMERDSIFQRKSNQLFSPERALDNRCSYFGHI